MRARCPHRLPRGFSLLELLVAVVIAGLLAAFALPQYERHLVRGRRAAAAACLTELAHFMERVYATQLVYNTNNGVATVLPATQCTTDLQNQYAFGFAPGQPTATTYTVQARPLARQASEDGACATLSLNQAGTRGISGSGNVADCWR